MFIEISLLAVFIIAVLFVAIVLKKFLVLLINSVIGFFALFATTLLLPFLVINVWSILLVAVGGIIGYLSVLILHLTGIAFV